MVERPALIPFKVYVKDISHLWEKSWNQNQPVQFSGMCDHQTSGSPLDDSQQATEQFWCPQEMFSGVISSWKEGGESDGAFPPCSSLQVEFAPGWGPHRLLTASPSASLQVHREESVPGARGSQAV